MKKTSTLQNGLIWFGAGVSLAEILTGTAFAPLGMAKGLAAILVGHIIGCAMMLLAGLSGVLIKGMAQNGKSFTILVQVTNWLPCLFLLPFLKRGEKWGWALAVLGLPLAVFLVIASQPGINQVLYAGGHNPLQVLHSHLAANTELLAALGIGGIYLLLPESRKT